MDPTSLLFAPLCWECESPLKGSSFFCFACNRRAWRSLADPRAGHLLPHQFPGALAGLRQGAPRRASQWFFGLLERHGVIERWRGLDAVVTAPRAARRRGLDGLSLLADRVAQRIGAKRPVALVKQSGHQQHGRSAKARHDAPLFIFPGPDIGAVRGRRVLLLDDVRTTGTTEEMAAFQLRVAGAAMVEAFVLVEQVVHGFDGKDSDAGQESEKVQPLLLHLTV